MFSAVGANGIVSGGFGGELLWMQGPSPQPSHSTSQSLELAADAHGSGWGKSLCNTPNSFKAVSERYKPFVVVDTCTIWRVIWPPYSIRRNTEPTIFKEDFVIPMIRWVVGTR